MGQCCQRLGGRREEESQSGKEVEMVSRQPPRSLNNTSNDEEFTYFLGVFELLSLGEKLEMPEYIDELNPQFSYQKFNHTYNEYQRQILALGHFIREYRNQKSPLSTRIRDDLAKVAALRQEHHLDKTASFGCLVKLEVQDFRWGSSRELGVLLSHPLCKFERWLKREDVEEGPLYVEFGVAEAKGGVLRLQGRGGKGEVTFELEKCLEKGQQLFCKVMRWKGAGELDGVALRLQLMSEDREGEEEKFGDMVALYTKLMKEYGVDGEISLSMNERQISDRLSRHRNSLKEKYANE